MERIYPVYYHEFKCIAGDCPDSCCHEWDVQVDPESANRYRAMEGALGDALRQHLYEEDGETYLRNVSGRCPMWRDDGLCRIQAEHGHDALCQVCQQFPRLRHEYGDFEEVGLEMSCPEAARLILTAQADHLCCQRVPGGAEGEYDPLDMEILRTTRARALEILSDGTLTVPQALTALLLYGYRAQGMLDQGETEPFSVESGLAMADELAQEADFRDLTAFYLELEILTERWRALLETGGAVRPWSEEDRRFARYLVQRYWLQAVSDFDLAGRVKFMVVSCLMARNLGGEAVQTIQLYSKEIENNTANVEAILDGAYTEPSMTDRGLLWLLNK